MRKSEWSDRELEELLRQMPKVQDHRNPRDIYQNLSIKRQKTRPWLLPGLAAAAALLLFFILVPKFMNETHFSFNNAQQEKSNATKEMKGVVKNNPIAVKKVGTPQDEGSSGTAKADKYQSNSECIKTAVYEDQVGNGTVLTYWIPDPQALILIPVSMIVPESKNQSWLTVFNENMNNLKEEEWGLTDLYPLNLTMKLDQDNQNIIVDVPKNQSYGQGGTNETSFMAVINKDVSSNSDSKKIEFTTNGQTGIDLGNFGHIEEVEVIPEKNHAFFFYYADGSELPLLTPSTETYKDINAALEAMKSDQPNAGLKGSLQPLAPINEVTLKDKTLMVSFKDNSSLEDNQLTLSSFEALLLTAKEFGAEKVLVKDTQITHLGSFDLSKEIKVPLAPNLRNIP